MSLLGLNKTLTLFNRLIDLSEPTRPMIDLPHEKPSLPLRRSDPPLPRSTPEREGVPSSVIAEFLNLLSTDDTLNMHSVTILRHGKILFEGAFGDEDLRAPKYLFSASKTFVSLACGMLIAEKKLTLDEAVDDIFPDKGSRLSRLTHRPISVRELLTMQSGISFNEADAMASADWLHETLSSASIGEMNRGFFYNSLNTYLLAAIVVRRSGVSLSEYLDQRLFAPLGITDYFWEKSAEGIERGGWGLYLRAEDLAKVGVLMLNGGALNGKQLIPAGYLAEATSAQAEPPQSFGDFRYGYQMWVGKQNDSFLFNGMLGQNMYCNTKNGLILVTFAGNSDMFQQSNSFRYLLRLFTGEFADTLPEDPEAYGALCALRDRICPGTAACYPAAEIPGAAGGQKLSALPVQAAAGQKLSFWERIRAFFVSAPEPPAPAAPAPAYPEELSAYFDREFRAEGKNAVGFFPITTQTILNSYTEGTVSLAFSARGGELLLTYTENGAVFEIPVGFSEAKDTELNVCGDLFRVRTRGVLHRDPRGRLVLETRSDFLELPSSRFLRLTFGFSTLLLEGFELPCEDTVFATLRTQADGLSESRSKLMGTLAGRLDGETLHRKTAELFEPKLRLKAVKRS